MTYKDSFNEFSKLYNQYYNQPYGQKEIIFDVNYTIGEEKKEFMFANSPIVYCGNLRTSAAPSKENTELYCLYDGGMKDGVWKFDFGTIKEYDQYMYAGHWDDPDYPAFDLNFDSCRSYFVDNSHYTDNNLFNLYHYNTFRNIAEQKMMTAYFYLTGDDIANLKLSDKIIVDNNTFIINKIYDWNPFTTDSTKVELVLFDSIYKVAPTRKKPIRISGGTITNIAGNINTLINKGNNIHPGANISILLGTGNQVSNVDGLTLINSDNNVIGPNTSDVVLINSNDVAVDDVEKIFAIGLDGNTTTAITSNTFYVNTSNIIMSGDNVTINNVSFNDVGMTLSGDVSVNNISATTIYSGSTNIESLFTPIAGYVWTKGGAANAIMANNTSGTLADGIYSVAGGNKVKIYNQSSVGFGESNISYGIASAVFGSNHIIDNKGHYSIAAGQNNTINAEGCSAFGAYNFAGDNYCHVEGYKNTSYGAFSYLVGSGNTLQGHAEGSAVIADHDITTDIPWTLYSKNIKVAQNLTADTIYTHTISGMSPININNVSIDDVGVITATDVYGKATFSAKTVTITAGTNSYVTDGTGTLFNKTAANYVTWSGDTCILQYPGNYVIDFALYGTGNNGADWQLQRATSRSGVTTYGEAVAYFSTNGSANYDGGTLSAFLIGGQSGDTVWLTLSRISGTGNFTTRSGRFQIRRT